MTTLAETVEVFAETTGIDRVAMRHFGNCLRDAGRDLVPLSAKGGGKATKHLEPRHFANLILSLGAAQASAGPHAAEVLGRFVSGPAKVECPGPLGYRLLASSNAEDESTEQRSLQAWLVETIDSIARLPKAERRECEAATGLVQMEISVGMSPPDAEVSWIDPASGFRVSNRWQHPQPHLMLLAEGLLEGSQPRAMVRRKTSVPFTLVFVAADLWADTLTRQQSDMLPSGTPAPRATPDAKTPAPRHREPASTRTQPPRKTATEVQDTSYPEPRMLLSRLQASACGTAGQPPDKMRLTYARKHSSDRSAA